MDEGEMLPVRLVQENGDVISLDATSVDIIVERQQSNFGIPFYDAKRMGIDVNQASVGIEIQGVMVDDSGQEASAQATATLDFYQPQQIVTWGQPIGGSSGGNPSGPIASTFNALGSSGSFGTISGITGNIGNSGSYSGGIGSSPGGGMTDFNDLGNKVLQYWNGKYIDFPVAYWTELGAALSNPISNGMQLWLKADSLSSDDGTPVTTWTDSSGNGRNAEQINPVYQPLFKYEGIDFNGVNHTLEVPFSPFFNSEEFTVFVIAKTHDSSGNQPVFSSTAGTTQGYGITIDATNKDVSAIWYDGAAKQEITSSSNSVKTDKYMFTYTMDDTDADSESDTPALYLNGTVVPTGVSAVYEPNASANFKIGTDGTNFFKGTIYEIIVYNRVLTQEEQQQVEGYLSLKYNINLPSGHEYQGTATYAQSNKHVRVVFDDKLVGSVEEPHGFLNQYRDTEMTVSGVSGNVISVIGGIPNEWFEVTQSKRKYTVEFRRNGLPITSSGRIFYGTVLSVTSSSLTIIPNISGVTILEDDAIFIIPIMYSNSTLIGQPRRPVIVVPIQNADTFDEFADPEKSVGPEFPAHEDGSARDDGGGIERTDEYITYLLSKAITASYLDTAKEVDLLSNTTMDKVFTATIGESYHGHNCRLTITQQYASSLGALSDTINTTLGVGQMPVTQGFSGGRSGKRVKSAGDKVQDLLGILANSQNFVSNPNINWISTALSLGADFINKHVYDKNALAGDYIRGIQIPYLTHVTKGRNALDSHVAQRNFFLTTEGDTSGKLSSINDIHSSRLFSHNAEGHLKNGISGLVADVNFHREAEMKAYEFSLKFIAADVIL